VGPRPGRKTITEGTIKSVGELVVVVGKQMSISVHRRADVGVTDVALNPKGMGALIDQEGDAGVPHPVRIEGPQAGLPHVRVQKRLFQLW